MKTLKTLFLILVSLLVFGVSQTTHARDVGQISDWYIKSFSSEITVNTDSSLDIVEKISADCGNLPEKHGIYRVLPTVYYPKSGSAVKTPIELKSITDFNGNSLNYQVTNSRTDKTITWKIGDADKTVTGVNNYQISYHVKNAIRHQDDFSELYWNLNGNFWELETDSYVATIDLPEGISKNSYKELNVYAGGFGENDNSVDSANWISDHQLAVRSTRTLSAGEGITLSLTFGKGIVAPYVPTFWEKYGEYFFLLLPLLVLIFCYLLWLKFGRDPRINPTVAPEFEIPEKLQPMEMGVVYSDGLLKSQYISAAIINLAVKKIIKIEEIVEGKIFKSKDYKLIRTGEPETVLTEAEKSLINKIFGSKNEIMLTDLKNKFYKEIPGLTNLIKENLVQSGLLVASSRTAQYVFLALGIISIATCGAGFAFSDYLGLGMIISGLIIIVFSFLMTRRTEKGLKLYKRIEGFKLYMGTAEKYRARFNEKENIFEKFLPYAIMFGMTREWVNKMKDIYGEEYFATYHPVWFYGAGLHSFNVDSLNSAINGVSSSMASTLSSSPSSSGSGGGGFSGGGGGGGGGGGW